MEKLNPLLIDELLRWADASLRPLPWRVEATPYHVWLSEIMLQQTRIEAVIPYYHRFLEALPTVKALAEADDDRLMKLWQGLGYYSRARNLKKAAGVIVEKYAGELPPEADELRSLPGIGDYTAGAIASIAFGRPEPAVDGNVLRVVMRLLACEEDVMQPGVRKEVTQNLKELYPVGDRASLLTQGLMELGEVICPPSGKPGCEVCPLIAFCKAHALGSETVYPIRSPKKARRVEKRQVYLILCGDKVALRKRPVKGLLAGLWEFPNVLCGEEDGIPATWKIKQKSRKPGPSAKHIFTHIEWHMEGIILEAGEKTEGFTWVSAEEVVKDYSIPTAFKVYTKYFLENRG